jgi:zinc/manganese transport system substrate-binding protein
MLRTLYCLICTAALLAACPSAEAKVKAVASFSIISDLVQRVGGTDITLTTIVGPNADTHVYEPKPDDAKAMADADIVFVNGLGFEGWQERLVQASGYQKDVITVSKGIETLTLPGSEGGVDPHAWQSATNAIIYTENIRNALCRADPASCQGFETRARQLVKEIAQLDSDIISAVAKIPAGKRVIITSHDAFGYFARAYGITFLAPEGVSTNSEASARDVANLIRQIRDRQATALFMETISDPRLIEQIASETGARIGGALFSDALSEPGEGASSYIEMMQHNAGLIIAAMSGS